MLIIFLRSSYTVLSVMFLVDLNLILWLLLILLVNTLQLCRIDILFLVFYNSSGSWVAVLFFPASNGHPRDPDSLHYIDPSDRFNAYQQVRLSIYC